jgi:anti-anti-sigma factor
MNVSPGFAIRLIPVIVYGHVTKDLSMPRTTKSPEKAANPGIHRIIVEKNIVDDHSFELEKKFQSELSRTTLPVVLDLTRTTLIDSRGIALCVGLLKECERKGVAFSIDVNQALARFFRLLKLDLVFQINERGNE